MCQVQLQARQRINSFNSHSTTMRQALLLPLSQTWGHRGAQRTWSITERAQTLLREAQSQHERLTPLSLFVIQFPLTFPPVSTYLFFHRIIDLHIERELASKKCQYRSLGQTIFSKISIAILLLFQNLPTPPQGRKFTFPPLGGTWVYLVTVLTERMCQK